MIQYMKKPTRWGFKLGSLLTLQALPACSTSIQAKMSVVDMGFHTMQLYSWKNQFIGGVDKSDQFLAYHNKLRKIVCYWKTFFYCFLPLSGYSCRQCLHHLQCLGTQKEMQNCIGKLFCDSLTIKEYGHTEAGTRAWSTICDPLSENPAHPAF